MFLSRGERSCASPPPPPARRGTVPCRRLSQTWPRCELREGAGGGLFLQKTPGGLTLLRESDRQLCPPLALETLFPPCWCFSARSLGLGAWSKFWKAQETDAKPDRVCRVREGLGLAGRAAGLGLPSSHGPSSGLHEKCRLCCDKQSFPRYPSALKTQKLLSHKLLEASVCPETAAAGGAALAGFGRRMLFSSSGVAGRLSAT